MYTFLTSTLIIQLISLPYTCSPSYYLRIIRTNFYNLYSLAVRLNVRRKMVAFQKQGSVDNIIDNNVSAWLS